MKLQLFFDNLILVPLILQLLQIHTTFNLSAHIFIISSKMNTDQLINSIYNPRCKTKQQFVFPKISKVEAVSPSPNFLNRGIGRKYNQQNIFKIQDAKRQKVKLHIEQQRIKEVRARQCQQLQNKIAQLMKNHQQEMKQIEENQKQIIKQIQKSKKENYQIKLGLWELKNQLMNLNTTYSQQEAQYQRLYDQLAEQQDNQQDEQNYQQGQKGQQDDNMLEQQRVQYEENASNLQESQGENEYEENRLMSVMQREGEEMPVKISLPQECQSQK